MHLGRPSHPSSSTGLLPLLHVACKSADGSPLAANLLLQQTQIPQGDFTRVYAGGPWLCACVSKVPVDPVLHQMLG